MRRRSRSTRPPASVQPCINSTVFGIDLSQPSVLFTTPILGIGISVLAIISALLQLVQSRMTLPPAGAVSDDQNTRIQRQTMLFVPLISIFYGGFLPAGLFIYWIVSTLFSIVQQYLILGWGGMFPHLRLVPGASPGTTPRASRSPFRRPIQRSEHRPRCSPTPTSEPPGRPRPSDPANAAAARADEGDDADMSAYQEFTGKTVEEALRNAREAFSVGLDDLDFEILTPGSRGVLGMGAEPARIVAAPRDALGGAAPKREAAAVRAAAGAEPRRPAAARRRPRQPPAAPRRPAACGRDDRPRRQADRPPPGRPRRATTGRRAATTGPAARRAATTDRAVPQLRPT